MVIEIMLTASGYRKQINSNTDLAKSEDHKRVSVIDESIPLKFRWKMYDKNYGFVWLFVCLLVHSVDTKIAKNMIQLYVNK